MTGTIRGFDGKIKIQPHDILIASVWSEHADSQPSQTCLTYEGRKVNSLAEGKLFADYPDLVMSLPWTLYQKNPVPGQTTLPELLPKTVNGDLLKARTVPSAQVRIFSVQAVELEDNGREGLVAVIGFSLPKRLAGKLRNTDGDNVLMCRFEDIKLRAGQKTISAVVSKRLRYKNLLLRGLDDRGRIGLGLCVSSCWFAVSFENVPEGSAKDVTIVVNGSEYPVTLLPGGVRVFDSSWVPDCRRRIPASGSIRPWGSSGEGLAGY